MLALLGPIGSLLGGTLGKVLMGGLAVAALVGGFCWWLSSHDAGIRAATTASMEAAEAKAVAAVDAADNAKIEAAESDLMHAQQARAATVSVIRTRINAAPKSDACASSAAVRAALDGLRGPDSAPGSGAAAAAPAKPVRVPAEPAGAVRTFR